MKQYQLEVVAAFSAALLINILTGARVLAQPKALDRTVLPIAEPHYPPITALDARPCAC